MPRSCANAESTKYRALLAGTLFFPWACTRATKLVNDFDIPLAHNFNILFPIPSKPQALPTSTFFKRLLTSSSDVWISDNVTVAWMLLVGKEAQLQYHPHYTECKNIH